MLPRKTPSIRQRIPINGFEVKGALQLSLPPPPFALQGGWSTVIIHPPLPHPHPSSHDLSQRLTDPLSAEVLIFRQ